MTRLVDLSKDKPEDLQTRDGKQVHGIAYRGREDINYPYVVTYGDTFQGYFTQSGYFEVPDVNHPLDIIRKPKTVTYVKSMAKILEENPDHYFDTDGKLRIEGLGSILHPINFKDLNKPAEEAWSSYLLEEREV